MFEEVFQGLIKAIGTFMNDAETEIDMRAAKVAQLVRTEFPKSAI